MERRKKDANIQAIEDQVIPLLNNLGITILELTTVQLKSRFQVRVVLFKPNGLSMDDCSEAHRLIFPRLEIIFPDKDVYLETASPGIHREIKSADEFDYLTGKNIKVLQENENDWKEGILLSAENGSVNLKTGEESMDISIKNIRKAKLVDVKESK